MPAPKRRFRTMVRQMMGPPATLAALARTLRTPLLHFDRSRLDRLSTTVIRLRPELIVAATFPALIPESLISLARYGGINAHQSLLPKGRGPDPLFWSYYDNDPSIGSTIHWMDAGYDTGDVIAQESIPIPRGQRVEETYFKLGAIGAAQISAVVTSIEKGSAKRVPQDHSRATYQPSPLKAEWRVRFDEWSAERTWHFLAGVGRMFGSLARDPAGNRLPMNVATAFATESHGRPAGTWERVNERLRLFCTDGTVDVTLPPLRRGPVQRVLHALTSSVRSSPSSAGEESTGR